jgi:hypothetical protein
VWPPRNNPFYKAHPNDLIDFSSNANKWIHVLLPVLHQTLIDLGDLPARHLQALKQRLAALQPSEDSLSRRFFMTAPNGRSPPPRSR